MFGYIGIEELLVIPVIALPVFGVAKLSQAKGNDGDGRYSTSRQIMMMD